LIEKEPTTKFVYNISDSVFIPK